MLLKSPKKSNQRSPKKTSQRTSKRSKKSPAKSSKKVLQKIDTNTKKPESSLARRIRESKEKELAVKQAKKQAEIDAKKEEERKHKIIYKYLEKLDIKLKELFGKDNGYRVWVDNPNRKISKPREYFEDLWLKILKNIKTKDMLKYI